MNKYKVIFAGHTFTRCSKNRTYTHAVIVTSLIADERAEAIRNAKLTWRRNLEYFQQLADGTSRFLRRNGNQFASVDDDTRIAHAVALLERGEQGEIDRNVRWLDESSTPKTPDGLCFVRCAGWCGRPDLAQKLAGSIKSGTPHIMPTMGVDNRATPE